MEALSCALLMVPTVATSESIKSSYPPHLPPVFKDVFRTPNLRQQPRAISRLLMSSIHPARWISSYDLSTPPPPVTHGFAIISEVLDLAEKDDIEVARL